jgi:hypothetical protein
VLSRGSGLLGEVAFMQHGVASATVRVLPGSSYYRWERREIDALLERRPAAHRSLQLMVGRELARKLNATNEELVKERRATKVRSRAPIRADPPLQATCSCKTTPSMGRCCRGAPCELINRRAGWRSTRSGFLWSVCERRRRGESGASVWA